MSWTAAALCDRADIIDLQHRYAHGIDRRDWALYRSVFADRIRIDFSDWHGGAPLEIAADEWVERVAARQSGFDATQHRMTNIVVMLDGDRARCDTYVVARHCLRDPAGDRIQAIGGHYDNQLERGPRGWVFTSCTLKVAWTTGDRALFDIAAQRWAERANGHG